MSPNETFIRVFRAYKSSHLLPLSVIGIWLSTIYMIIWFTVKVNKFPCLIFTLYIRSYSLMNLKEAQEENK